MIPFVAATRTFELSHQSPSGWLVIDKPRGMTSRAAVDGAANRFPRKTKIGHAGTLDPLATGVLVLAVGIATRLIEYVQDMPKVYTATIALGATSVTDDAEGPITPTPNSNNPGQVEVEATLASFIGITLQAPPAYSAVHVAGRRAYQAARAGKVVQPQAKPVHIDRIELLSYEYPGLRLRITCGKGTYIRSLARDLGARLGCGAYVSALCRTAVGDFQIEHAQPIDGNLGTLLPIDRGLTGLPRHEIAPIHVSRFVSGQAIPHDGAGVCDALACFDPGGQLIGIGRVCNQRLWPSKILSKAHAFGEAE